MASQLSLFTECIPTVAKFPSTRYQGSKQKFVDWIWECIKDIPFHSALDAFGGTGSVSFRLKEEGKQVIYNDILPFNHIIGKALIENKDTYLNETEVNNLFRKQNDIVYPDFIERTFKDIYFTDEENRWLDMVSTNIRRVNDPYKQAIAYFALFQSCIIKRPYNLFHRRNLYVRLQEVERSFGNKKTWDTPFEVHFRKFVEEANNAVFNNGEQCRSINYNIFDVEPIYDFVYIDTPYLNDSGVGVDYADFYHFLNGLVDYDNWNTQIDYKSKHLRLFRQPNVWNDSATIHQAFEQLFTQFRHTTMAISYRSNGIPTINELVDILEKLGKSVKIHQSGDIKYVLSTKQTNEVLIVAQ
ncbi:MAG: DNA adenine methylase [Bacteroidaceae bacterium]|nr:DNA adenine methylase [Bacteroidaceae bacterium]